MRIYACPKCGCKKIHRMSLHVGALTGDKYICDNCSYQGMPVIFETEDEFKEFVDELRGNKKTKKKIKEKTKQTKEEKELYGFLKEEKNRTETEIKQKKPYGLIILTFITIIYSISLSITFLSYPLLTISSNIILFLQVYITLFLILSIISIIAIPYGFLKGKPWAYTLSGSLFIFAIPIGLLFLYYLTRPHVKKHFNKK